MSAPDTVELSPNEQYPVSVNWAENVGFDSTAGDSLVESTWTTRSGLTVDTASFDEENGIAYAWLREGATPGVYRVVNKLVWNNTTTPFAEDKKLEHVIQVVVTG